MAIALDCRITKTDKMMSTAVDHEEVEDDFSIMSCCWSPQKKVVIVNVPLEVSTRTKMSSSTTDRLPAALREELRRLVALKGMGILFKKSSMKVCGTS